MGRETRDYDTRRKKETFEKLKKGFEEIKKEHPNKPVTKYGLSKHTGVARQTISKYEDIVDMLENQKEFNGAKGIKTRKDVKKLVESTSAQLKEKNQKYEALLKENTQLNLQIVQLNDEIKRLNDIVEKYKRMMKND